MKRGQEVYIIVKGTVVKCVVTGREQKTQTISMMYKKGGLTKVYKRPIWQVATAIERGINGVQGSSESSTFESNKGRNKKNSELCESRVSDGNGQIKSDKVFVGSWRILNMA